ncbi:MAG: ATP-binding protein [Bacilli bacterium]
MEEFKEIERSIITTYRKTIWRKFIEGIKKYELVKENDKIAICISGGKDSFLLAKCMQELQIHGKIKFELVFLVMNPGYNQINLDMIIENSKKLNIPITIFDSSIFDIVSEIKNNPCYLCARMRRGHLYNKAKELGCNKIALGHHFNDVIETILLSMFYGSEVKTMMPKLHSTNFEGMELIRPLYLVKEEDIITWKNFNNLTFLNCACRFTENCSITDEGTSKRAEIKQFIKNYKKINKNIDINIFKSIENINLETIIGYHKKEKTYNFLDDFDK